MPHMRSIVSVLIVVLAATSASAAQGGRGPKARHQLPTHETGRVELSVGPAGFNLSVQQTIRGYYSTKAKAPRGRLPKGIAKHYARGKRLPPGIAKRTLPPDLLYRLPAYPGHEYVVVDRDVLLIAVATGIVVDVVIDAL